MNNSNDKSVKDEQMDNKKMNELQDQLDIAVFEQEEMDVDKVKEILDKMENISPDQEKKGFDKENLWKRIEEQSREEFAEEQILEFDRIKAGKNRKSANISVSGMGRASKVRRIALVAATIVIAVFVGANIGTYATEKKNVFEYVGDLSNGTSFWVTGDATSMDVEKEKQVYYSWNDVPDEYKEFLVIPQGLPEDMELYSIEIQVRDTFEWSTIRYVDDNAQNNLMIKVALYDDEEFSFANIKYEEKYEFTEGKSINGVDLFYYKDTNGEITAQFFDSKYVYTFSGILDESTMCEIVEMTIKNSI